MFKKILVPTDFSKSSRQALITALKFAQQFNSEIELFHVIEPPRTYSEYTGYYGPLVPADEMEELAVKALDSALAGIEVGDVRLHKKHVSGKPALQIIEKIKEDFDLVIMGCRGYGGNAGAILGSVTQRVLAYSTCPVLVVYSM